MSGVQLHAPLIQCREVRCVKGVGYNHTRIAERPAHFASVLMGRSVSYLRCLGNSAQVGFRGYRVPLIGRMSMDAITIGVSGLSVDDPVQVGAFDLIDAAHNNAGASEADTNCHETGNSLGTPY